MANAQTTYAVQVTDFNGDTAEVTMHSRASTTAAATDLHVLVLAVNNFAAAVAACTNGKITEQRLTVLVDKAQYVIGATPPFDNKYPSVTDGSRLQFANALGERISITVPAPLETNFGAGSMVVDPTDANVGALITFIEANALDNAGNPLNLYKGGIKVGRRARRRRSALRP